MKGKRIVFIIMGTDKILLKIHTYQETLDGKEDMMELVTVGRHVNKRGTVYLVYEETELSGMDGCVTSLKIDGESVKLRRYGLAMGQELHFAVRKKVNNQYDTPVGPIDLEILTTAIKNELNEEGNSGQITIEYDICLKSILDAHNVLEIQVSPLKEQN